ncbi:YdiK family protein [Cytobacillus gottheilii]|uniref:YdiK family protein n=1 Tax=Cytobacillus gottheilii TaxID=859144 RepID=UPI0009B95623|nr:YdiK family protein [Cytobacillus gottheilii]
MRRSPLFSGIVYLILGILFVYIAIQSLQQNGDWGFMTNLLIIIATFDIGAGLKMISFHFKLKNLENKK